ncbi:MFS transporter [Thaumasiovibrio subtropicus]|uniref:MFS transporter n=1 Tax=Thaumasiovibrio subtropicus TaxID=1891207 RepID=UPI000B35E5C4|nr:MFS transporter [Thaumasiovibrio subtropicus]
MRQTRPLLLALIANGAGHAYFAISLPALGRAQMMADLHVGLIMSLSALLLIITGPIWGWACDRFGRKQILAIGLISSAVTTFLLALLIKNAALLPGLFANMLLGIRVLQAALSAGLKPATQATVSDITAPNNRMQAMGVMGATFGAGTLLGGLLAIMSGQNGLVEGFIALSVLMTLSSLWVCFKLPETHNATTKVTASTFTLTAPMIYLVSTVICLTIYSALQPITGWRLQDAFALNGDQTIKTTGGIMMSSMLAMIVAQIGLSCLKHASLTAQHRVRMMGSVFAAVALLLCALSSSPMVLALGMGLLGMGFGLFLPANLALMTSRVADHQQGKLAGLNGLSQGVGLTLGPALGSLIYQYHPQLPFYVAAAAMVFLVLLAIQTPKFKPPQEA